MARYILLAFESDQDALDFVDGMQNASEHGFDSDKVGHIIPITTYVRGMWKMPTMFCKCGINSDVKASNMKQRGWTRGRKFGWWVCTICHKPGAGWARGDAWYTALGTNLLPISESAPEYRGPDHKNHPSLQS